MFHIDTYTTAFKYDCGALVHSALANASNVMTQVDALDLLALLEKSYSRGLTLAQLCASPGALTFVSNGLRDAYAHQMDIMSRVAMENPHLCLDLLGLFLGDRSV